MKIYECEEGICELVVFWPFWCRVVAYSMWWDGFNYVGVSVLAKWEFLGLTNLCG